MNPVATLAVVDHPPGIMREPGWHRGVPVASSMAMRGHRSAAVVLAAAAIGAGAVAWAQKAPRKLHEDVPSPSGDDSSPLVGSKPEAGQNPEGFASGDKLLPEPELAPKERGEEVFGRDGFSTDRQTQSRPDYKTGPDGTLHYVSVFNPDVMPFKRMSVARRRRRRLHRDHRAAARSPTSRSAAPPTRAATASGRSVMIELTPGVDVPLPSVAPDMRILSYETQPKIARHLQQGRRRQLLRPHRRVERRRPVPAGVPRRRRRRLLRARSCRARPTRWRRVRELAMRDGLLPVLPAAILSHGAARR